MLVPLLRSRTIQRRNLICFGIDGGEIRTLPAITQDARKSQVFQRCRTTVLLGDYVIDLMPRDGVRLMNQTVLATVTGPLTPRSPHGPMSTMEPADAAQIS